MKIIYDTNKPAHRRVEVISDKGEKNPIPVALYDIKILCDGWETRFKRWGKTKKERDAQERAITEELEKERQSAHKGEEGK